MLIVAAAHLAATSGLAAPKAKQPHWIWLSKPAAPGQQVAFRKTFQAPKEVKSALLTASCDNHLTVYLDGKRVAHSNDWNRAVKVDVTKQLKPGDNVLAVLGKNDDGPGGLVLRLEMKDAKGKSQVVVTDASWRASLPPEKPWQTADFDDAAWRPAVSIARLGAAPWGDVFSGRPARRGGGRPGTATDPENITTLPGFKVERLYSVPKPEQGSWVSMTNDPQGRLICSDQGGSLYRVTVGKDEAATKVEKLEVAIGQAQGLLYAFDSLYVTVNGRAAQGSGFYRVRDTDGDDQFDQVTLLKKLRGGGEHGPHGIRLGPDGKLYVIAGNHTAIPDGCAPTSPHKNWAEDLLLPRNPDGRGHATGRMAPGGWIARTDKDGKHWELFCAGFRNQYDIDFNEHGELFTYDSDMEWDTGTPWYRPTRVNHCVSGGEYGWRFGTGKWPPYFADSLPGIDIGLGSPTGVTFGTGAKFPARYQRALYINDWTYGRIYALHLEPAGASYRSTFEQFVTGRPLPVTDVVVNVDGAMYFTIGGRGTQSGLYRVTYVGEESTQPAKPLDDPNTAKSRTLRRELEAFHGHQDPKAIETAWPHLGSSDRFIRYAARVAVEHQPLEQWRDKALAEKRPTAAIQAMIALARSGDKSLLEPVLTRLNELPLERLGNQQLLAALRAYQLAFIRLGPKDGPDLANPVAKAVADKLSPLFPHASEEVSRELCRLLVYLRAPGVIDRAMQRVKAGQTQQDQLYYIFLLRNLKDGWTPEQRRAYFGWLNLAEKKYRGGASFKRFVQQIRQDAVAKLSEAEKQSLAKVIAGGEAEPVGLETTRQFIHNWQMSDLEPMLPQVESGRSFEKGRAAFRAAQCFKCHRFADEGGDTGPDLTGVGNRFKPQYLLEALITPSKVISDQYRNTVFETEAGETFVGRVIKEEGGLLHIRTDPFARELTKVKPGDIVGRTPSPISEMPQGLLNVLTKEEILDLIAYMRSGGDAKQPYFAAGKR